MPHSYSFMTTQFRGQCQRVLDGDTVELFVDRGNYDFSYWQIRLYAIDTYELRGEPDPVLKAKAKEAKALMLDWLKPPTDRNAVNLATWPVRVLTYKDDDNFGRLLAEIYWTDAAGIEHHANGELLQMGLAVPFKR